MRCKSFGAKTVCCHFQHAQRLGWTKHKKLAPYYPFIILKIYEFPMLTYLVIILCLRNSVVSFTTGQHASDIPFLSTGR